MRARFVVSSLEHLRLLSDPLRLRIVELLRDAALSPKQTAVRLSLKPTRLYRHFLKLEAAGLIEQVSSRRRRGVTERLYRSVAKLFVVDRALFATSRGPAERSTLRASRSIFEATGEDLEAAIESGVASLHDPRRSEVASAQLSVPVAALPKLIAAVHELFRAASRAERTRGEPRTQIRLTAALFPIGIAARRAGPTEKR